MDGHGLSWIDAYTLMLAFSQDKLSPLSKEQLAVVRNNPVTFFLRAQAVLRESRELHGDLESMAEKVELLSEVLQVESMSQQVCELSRHTEELQQSIKTRLQSLQDADKVQRI